MSYRLNIGITIGTLAIMLLTTSVIIYFTKETKDAQEQQRVDFNNFVDKWDHRIKVSNQFNNESLGLSLKNQRQILNLTEGQQKIFQKQLDNEKTIIGNLTDHRKVTNFTRDDIIVPLLNKTNKIINQTQALTGPEYSKLADEKVNNIVKWVIGNLTENGFKRSQTK